MLKLLAEDIERAQALHAQRLADIIESFSAVRYLDIDKIIDDATPNQHMVVDILVARLEAAEEGSK
jgi:hypothetical protein